MYVIKRMMVLTLSSPPSAPPWRLDGEGSFLGPGVLDDEVGVAGVCLTLSLPEAEAKALEKDAFCFSRNDMVIQER